MSRKELEIWKIFRYNREYDWFDIEKETSQILNEAIKEAIDLRLNGKESVSERKLMEACVKIALGLDKARHPKIRKFLENTFDDYCIFKTKEINKDYRTVVKIIKSFI